MVEESLVPLTLSNSSGPAQIQHSVKYRVKMVNPPQRNVLYLRRSLNKIDPSLDFGTPTLLNTTTDKIGITDNLVRRQNDSDYIKDGGIFVRCITGETMQRIKEAENELVALNRPVKVDNSREYFVPQKIMERYPSSFGAGEEGADEKVWNIFRNRVVDSLGPELIDVYHSTVEITDCPEQRTIVDETQPSVLDYLERGTSSSAPPPYRSRQKLVTVTFHLEQQQMYYSVWRKQLDVVKWLYENRTEVRDYARAIGYQDVVELLPTLQVAHRTTRDEQHSRHMWSVLGM